MASDNSAAVISLHHTAPKSKAMTGAERAKAYRDRKRKAAAPTEASPPSMAHSPPTEPEIIQATPAAPPAPSEPCLSVVTSPPVTMLEKDTPVTVAPAYVTPSKFVTPSRQSLSSITLMAAAVALAGVGVAINGWFARSLGSSDVAGWLFLALGVAADLVALGMPSCATNLWHLGQRGTALAGWFLWLVTFVFAVTAGLGFASTNVSDITLTRASRVTLAVTAAQATLADAMSARDRECKGGVGKFCRDREAAVAERRQALDAAQAAVGQQADPQTDAAIRLVAWASRDMLRPMPEDFAMLRLMLLALLPQIGGLLMMVARRNSARP